MSGGVGVGISCGDNGEGGGIRSGTVRGLTRRGLKTWVQINKQTNK